MNWIAIIVAAIVNFALGYVWYRPEVLGKRWAALTGRKMEDMGQAGPGYAVVVVATLVTAIVLAYLVKWTGTTTLVGGAGLGLVAWLGFVATGTAANYVFEGRPWALFGIVAGYQLIGLILMGAILGAWH
jgi:hypothetical protein